MATAREGTADAASSKELKEQVDTVKHDVSELGRAAKAAAGEKIDEAKHVAQDKVQEARDKAKHYVDAGRERADVYEDKLLEYVRTKPLKSVAIAAGVGFVIGFLGRR